MSRYKIIIKNIYYSLRDLWIHFYENKIFLRYGSCSLKILSWSKNNLFAYFVNDRVNISIFSSSISSQQSAAIFELNSLSLGSYVTLYHHNDIHTASIVVLIIQADVSTDISVRVWPRVLWDTESFRFISHGRRKQSRGIYSDIFMFHKVAKRVP